MLAHLGGEEPITQVMSPSSNKWVRENALPMFSERLKVRGLTHGRLEKGGQNLS